MHQILLVLLLALPTTAATGQACDAVCRTASTYARSDGTVFWVDVQHPAADDAGPGSQHHPWRTLGRAAAAAEVRPGDAVVVREGVYREALKPRRGGSGPAARITYAAFPGEAVVITGADPLDGGWRREGQTWRHAWTERLPAYGTDVFRRELVVANGRALRPVFRRADLAPGTFFVEGPDTAPVALYLRLPGDATPADYVIEAGRRHPLFWPVGPDASAACGAPTQPGWLRVVGFTFRHAANRAQRGAVCPGSAGSLFEDNTIEWTNGLGLEAGGRDHVFRRNRLLDNGQMGLGGRCTGCLFEDNVSARNNWKGHDPYWEAGGGKLVETTGTTFRRHLAHDNAGPGLWLDIRNRDNLIEASRFVANEVAGILLELETTGTVVRNNVIAGTRWRGWSGTGLLVQAAARNVIVHNTFVENAGTGLWLRLDPERRAEDGHNVVYNNLFVRNVAAARGDAREVQVEGRDLAHARTNRFDGNQYWPHRPRMETSTFYFAPDAASPANFRHSDLGGWRRLVAGDAGARLLDPARPLLLPGDHFRAGPLAPGAEPVGSAATLPAGVPPVLEDASGRRRGGRASVGAYEPP